MSQSKFEYKIKIREHDVDSYGHLNNASYLMLFEEARWEIVNDKGFSFAEIHNKKQGPVVLEVNLKFIKEILLREDITIITKVTGYKGKIGFMNQQMLKVDGTLACDAQFTFGLFDMNLRKLIEPTDEWRKALMI